MADTEEQRVPGTSEEEPLLGRAGDASQQDGKPLYHNLVIGMLRLVVGEELGEDYTY